METTKTTTIATTITIVSVSNINHSPFATLINNNAISINYSTIQTDSKTIAKLKLIINKNKMTLKTPSGNGVSITYEGTKKKPQPNQ